VVPPTRRYGRRFYLPDMAAQLVGNSPTPMSLFLVERYLDPSAAIGLPDRVGTVARLCATSAPGAAGVAYLYSAYLPSEDTCFCLFAAGTADTVRAINDRAEFALDRITGAVQMFPPHPAPDDFGRTTPS